MELVRQAAVNDSAECCGNFATKCACVECSKLGLHSKPDITFGWVIRGVKRLNRQFTFAARTRNIEPELPSKPLGTGNFTDASTLIPLTTDFRLATLSGVQDAVILAAMVLCGVYGSSYSMQVFYLK